MQSILAIEDDPVLGEHLKGALEARGFRVTLANEGGSGLALASTQRYDLILLDVLLPGLDGMEVLRRLRRSRQTPVLMMSALGEASHRIQGFEDGADDYLPKPFSLDELQVRIAAILRRVAYEQAGQGQPVDEPDGFDVERCDVLHAGRWLELTPTEYRLLKLLRDHAGEVLSKAFLYQQVLHRGYSRHDRGLDMHVSNVRRKLIRAELSSLRVEAVWGQGYVLRWQTD
ncbi:response regulator transcription factor [Halopseudomonas xinjiangensis]|nr:response regulator transcription factor [Halopseudomonas xinjiangensis]